MSPSFVDHWWKFSVRDFLRTTKTVQIDENSELLFRTWALARLLIARFVSTSPDSAATWALRDTTRFRWAEALHQSNLQSDQVFSQSTISHVFFVGKSRTRVDLNRAHHPDFCSEGRRGSGVRVGTRKNDIGKRREAEGTVRCKLKVPSVARVPLWQCFVPFFWVFDLTFPVPQLTLQLWSVRPAVSE